MKPEKVLICKNCEARVPDTSKYRGRFKRRHPVKCSDYAENVRTAQELNEAARKKAEGNDGTRVDLSGTASVVGEVATEVLSGGVE